MERWSIQVDKQYLKFSAAHFLIFPDGSAERLHGHNYRVYVEVEGPLCPHGLVLDFIKVKPIVQSIVDGLDEHWLIPGTHLHGQPQGDLEQKWLWIYGVCILFLLYNNNRP